ncbi:MAG: ATP synthase F1 subunit delta [Bacteroidetes bacterium MedPE-SWsnd-G2]|nr:MAG: ATP synthase F1 subunit delta [Bacteroidetes bacterium MedPE-SWsnd-G2]
MAQTRAAIRYAKAVLSLAKDQNATEAVNADMLLMVKTINDSTELADALQSAVVTSEVKKSVLLEVFPKLNVISVNLINTLVVNKRINLIEVIAETYSHLYDELNGVQVAEVTTAVPLTGDLENKVLAKVKELTGKEASINSTVDESILGGFILRVGDIQYNASIANKLSKLKREFTLN